MHFHFSGIEYIKDIFGMIYFQSLINWMNKHMTKSHLCCSVQSILKSDYWKSFIIQKKKTGYLFVKTLHPLMTIETVLSYVDIVELRRERLKQQWSQGLAKPSRSSNRPPGFCNTNWEQ